MDGPRDSFPSFEIWDGFGGVWTRASGGCAYETCVTAKSEKKFFFFFEKNFRKKNFFFFFFFLFVFCVGGSETDPLSHTPKS